MSEHELSRCLDEIASVRDKVINTIYGRCMVLGLGTVDEGIYVILQELYGEEFHVAIEEWDLLKA